MGSCELDKGDEESERSGLANPGNDVEADLSFVHACFDVGVADASV